MDQPDTGGMEATQEAMAARVRAVRSRLPGQMLSERIDMARVWYGPLHSLVEIQQKIAETLPRRFGFSRSAVLEPIESYGEPIPDEVLLKYDDAVQKGLFSRFWVARPSYFQQPQSQPCLLGEVSGADLYAVVAQWSMVTGS